MSAIPAPKISPDTSAAWLGPARRRAFVAAGLLLAVGGALAFAPRPNSVRHDEKWVADGLPTKVADFRMMAAQDPSVPYCSYKMDPATYQILQPWGIVPRVFQRGGSAESYDVVVIGSNLKDSFHDPGVCFSAQGWNLSNAREETLATKAYGAVPVTLVDMEREGQKTIAMYFYRLREGYVASNTGAKKEMLVYKLRRFGKDNEGGFIRIIPNGAADLAKLKAFAAQWVDEAAKTSGGYY